MSKRKLLALPVIFIIVLLAFVAGGCAPAPNVYTIPPNATGFLIPASNTKAQAKFQSERYLKANQVAAHQVVIQQHCVGNNSNGCDYYPDDILVLVDRSTVTRAWTDNAGGGTSRSNQAFSAYTADGISFKLDANCTAQVTDQDAARYLFNYSGSAKATGGANVSIIDVNTLPAVMDNNVRGDLQRYVSNLFNPLTYDAVRAQSAALFETAVVSATADFARRGITVTACGLQGGPKPDDPQVAQAYNNAQASQGATLKAYAQATAQAIINSKNIAQHAANATAVSLDNQANINYLERQGQLASKYPGLAGLTQAQRWNGQPPQVVGGGGNWLLTVPQPTVHP